MDIWRSTRSATLEDQISHESTVCTENGEQLSIVVKCGILIQPMLLLLTIPIFEDIHEGPTLLPELSTADPYLFLFTKMFHSYPYISSYEAGSGH